MSNDWKSKIIHILGGITELDMRIRESIKEVRDNDPNIWKTKYVTKSLDDLEVIRNDPNMIKKFMDDLKELFDDYPELRKLRAEVMLCVDQLVRYMNPSVPAELSACSILEEYELRMMTKKVYGTDNKITVEELIKELQKCDPKNLIFVDNLEVMKNEN